MAAAPPGRTGHAREQRAGRPCATLSAWPPPGDTRVDRDRAAEDCSGLLDLVSALRERWRASPDPLVRDLAPRLDELLRVLGKLEWLLRR